MSVKQYQPVRSQVIPSLSRMIEGIKKAIDAALNGVFSLTHQASIIRSWALTVGFVVAWMVAAVWVVPGEQWRTLLAEIMKVYTAVPMVPSALVSSLVNFAFATFLHPVVIRHLLAIFAPYWLMHRITAIYLADVLEKDEDIARQFIMQAAFGGRYNTLHIRQGKIAEEDKGSSIVQIGGPGYVTVELDSAALFERPDGTPHVIQPGLWNVVDDFERLRRIVDLRDTVDQLDLPPTRSRDGIVVGAKDVQFSYSIHRGDASTKSADAPYPFNPKAIENLVYKDTRTVKPGVAPARVPEWELPAFKINGAIIAEMAKFISSRGLSEFLANIGEPEEQSLVNREVLIDLKSQALSGLNGNHVNGPPLTGGQFSPRSMLTDLFYKQDDFQKRMADKGFKLNWIGVGTWFTPADNILANHREAWKTSRENFARGNPQELQRLHDEAKLQELLRLVQTLPINMYYLEREKLGEEKLVDEMLREYEELLRKTADLYSQGGNSLDRLYAKFLQAAETLENRPRSVTLAEFQQFLTSIVHNYNQSLNAADPLYENFLRGAVSLNSRLGSQLDSEDQALLIQAINIYNDINAYNQLLTATQAIFQLRYPHHPIGGAVS